MTFVATIDMFSGLSVRPKCNYGWGSAPHPAARTYSLPSDPLAGGQGACCPSSRTPFLLSRPLPSNFSPSGLRCCCCDSPAALLLPSVVQVVKVCDRSQVVPQVLHCELRRMALTVEQMFYGVWCDKHLICRW